MKPLAPPPRLTIMWQAAADGDTALVSVNGETFEVPIDDRSAGARLVRFDVELEHNRPLRLVKRAAAPVPDPRASFCECGHSLYLHIDGQTCSDELCPCTAFTEDLGAVPTPEELASARGSFAGFADRFTPPADRPPETPYQAAVRQRDWMIGLLRQHGVEVDLERELAHSTHPCPLSNGAVMADPPMTMAEAREDNRLWTIEQMLGRARADVLADPNQPGRALLVLVYPDDDGGFHTQSYRANLKRSDEIALLTATLHMRVKDWCS